MSESDKNGKRFYRVILLDRTTNSKVNYYIRELIGASIWEASTLMNAVPSVIVDNIPLHKAIEIKSRLNRFGLNSKIESIDEETKPQPGIVPPPPARRSETVKEESQPEEDEPSAERDVEQEPESPPMPQPPSRLRKRKRKKIPLFYIFSLFLILIIIIIIWLLVPPDYLPRVKHEPRIVASSPENLPKKLKVTRPPAENVIDNIITYPGGGSFVSNIPDSMSEEISGYDTSEPPSASDGEPASDSSGVYKPPYDLSLKPQSSVSAAPGIASPVSSAGQSGKRDNSSMPTVMKSNLGQPAFPGGPGFISADTGPGLSQKKLDDILREAERTARENDLKSAGTNMRRLDLARNLAQKYQPALAPQLNNENVGSLLNKMERMADRNAAQEGVEIDPEITGAGIIIHVNLPDGSIFGVNVRQPGGEEDERKFTLSSQDNVIRIPLPQGLPSGVFRIRLQLLPHRIQPISVLDIIGENGEELKGRFIDEKGEVDYSFSLQNMTARTRGEISTEEAEAEFARLVKRAGENNYRLEDFDSLQRGTAAFVTIAADNVDETDFIVKACRSIGMLSKEMDNPPQYLRLIVNGNQYFIPAYICRRALKDFRQDDPSVTLFLINHLITL